MHLQTAKRPLLRWLCMLFILGALASACGGGGGTPPTAPGGAPGADPAVVTNALLVTTFPATTSPYTFGSVQKGEPSSADMDAGVRGVVQVTFKGGDGQGLLTYRVFETAGQVREFGLRYSNGLPTGNARVFLPYFTTADCAETSRGGTCGSAVGNVFVVATASKVPQYAAALIEAGVAHVRAAVPGIGAPPTQRAAPAPSGPDPCTLVTQAEAEAALGSKLRADGQGGRVNPQTCAYASTGTPGDGISVEAVQPGGRARFAAAKQGATSAKAIKGIGDDAFEFGSQAGFVTVYAVKGDAYVSVTFVAQKDTARAAKAEDLAKRAVARLK